MIDGEEAGGGKAGCFCYLVRAFAASRAPPGGRRGRGGGGRDGGNLVHAMGLRLAALALENGRFIMGGRSIFMGEEGGTYWAERCGGWAW